MTNPFKIAVLCNNRMAFPALQSLLMAGRLCALGVPENNIEITEFCSMLSKQSGIPLFIMAKENSSDMIKEMINISGADAVFTMTFPWKISSEILILYPGIFYNFHYGLLPEMRGADPVFETIRSGAGQSGITVHVIDKCIDKGPVILKKSIPVSADLTHGGLCTHLSWLGANLLNELLNLLQSYYKGTKQDENQARYYPKPGASDVCISWEKQDAKAVEALVRACNPWNKGAYTQWNGWNIRVVEATVINKNHYTGFPGTILSLDKENGLIVRCSQQSDLKVDIVYTEEGFMSGYKLSAFGLKKGEQFMNL
ncbi:formyltransferase family protein [Chryseobacterium hagamense]|uniref:Methionyl-tRNA formyltransferase n=1 Tax=Chryseobacterium hagamense TaxID=395935 RepID=A0A511YLK2_9FLAO|nr:formyltransferase family protein [Chryseobacterium hagamense]GEN76084.1 methionyl-tRNA formyltransferase [Chryseobacterium hagamense]